MEDAQALPKIKNLATAEQMKLREKLLANISTASACILLWVWVLPGTIALRHGLLGIGCIAGISLIKENWTKLSSAKINLIPLFLITALFFWVGVHYFFFSLNPELELSEIKGLWARSLAGCIMAVGFGISLSRYSHLRNYFYISIFAVPIINTITYFYDCYITDSILKPNDFVKFYFAKIETAYFGGIATAVAVANLVFLFSGKVEKKDYPLITYYFLGIALVLFSAMVSSTKNGIAISMALCLLLALIIVIRAFKGVGSTKKVAIVVLTFLMLLVALVGYGHKSFAPKGWDSIFEDVKVAIDIDKNNQWQFREGTVEAPLNSLGVPAALNTYVRFAYITVGMQLINKHPLGYGSINQSFNSMQGYENIYHEHTGQVHSGWVDFGLAYGFPGLGLMLLVLLSIVCLGVRQRGELPLVAVMYCLMLIPFGVIAEISYKQYFEATLFFIAFSSTVVAFSPIRPIEKTDLKIT